jgi:GxxExxY protein
MFSPQRTRGTQGSAKGVYLKLPNPGYFNIRWCLIDFGMSASAEFLNETSSIILKSAIAVHQEMGPGLLEGVYQQCMIVELRNRGLVVNQMVPVKLHYKGIPINKEYIVDILVENEIILELKSIDGLLKIHEAQIISYLRLTNKRLGFLINFNVPLLKQGFRRFVNNL